MGSNYTTRSYVNGKWLIHGPTLPDMGWAVDGEFLARTIAHELDTAFTAKDQDHADKLATFAAFADADGNARKGIIADRDQLRTAVEVLGREANRWNAVATTRVVHGTPMLALLVEDRIGDPKIMELHNARADTDANPLARAAVEGATACLATRPTDAEGR